MSVYVEGTVIEPPAGASQEERARVKTGYGKGRLTGTRPRLHANFRRCALTSHFRSKFDHIVDAHGHRVWSVATGLTGLADTRSFLSRKELGQRPVVPYGIGQRDCSAHALFDLLLCERHRCHRALVFVQEGLPLGDELLAVREADHLLDVFRGRFGALAFAVVDLTRIQQVVTDDGGCIVPPTLGHPGTWLTRIWLTKPLAAPSSSLA